jgi:hypothetical protein
MIKDKNKQRMFVEIGFCQMSKFGNMVCGDAFMSKKYQNDHRHVAVLSDGLGSGIKANVLSTMTASMALNFCHRNEPVMRSALSIMKTLPSDSLRNISYATFTIVDIDNEGDVTIVEYDNPGFLALHGEQYLSPEKTLTKIENGGRMRKIYQSKLSLYKGDRLIFFSDGVNQSGIGMPALPFGWECEGVREFVHEIVAQKPDISALELSRKVVKKACQNDGNRLQDDTTCAVVYLREPRRLLICSGPPYDKEKDAYLADIVRNYQGKKIICGGTTSQIISRELHKEMFVDLFQDTGDLPPTAQMDGIDLITEGILTLGAVAELLGNNQSIDSLPKNPAGDLARMIIKSDIIDLVIGTRINEAHQDPNLPVELEIRRNVIKKIAFLLEEKYLKKVKMKYI